MHSWKTRFRSIYSIIVSSAIQGLPYERTPVGRLPEDVLQYIFEIGTWNRDNRDDSIIFPFLVSHVCRAWFQLARVTPTLWTLILVNESDTNPHFYIDRRRLLLSQNCALTVHIDFRIPGGWDFEDHPVDARALMRIFSVLQDHFWRVRSLTLISDNHVPAKFAVNLLQKYPMPHLEYFEANRFRAEPLEFSPAHPIGPQPLLKNSKIVPGYQLKSMSLLHVHADWAKWTSTNLVRLTISYIDRTVRPSIGNFRAVIGSCAHTLEYLEIQAAAPIVYNDEGAACYPQIPYEDRAFLPKLKELVLGYVEPMEAVLVVKLFSYPALKALTICDLGRKFVPRSDQSSFQYDSSSVLEALCQHDTCTSSIEDLLLDDVQCGSSPKLAFQFLQSFPVLRSLVFKRCSHDFVIALAQASSTTVSEERTQVIPGLPCALLRDLTLINMDAYVVHASLECRALLSMGGLGRAARLASLTLYKPKSLSRLTYHKLEMLTDVVQVDWEYWGRANSRPWLVELGRWADDLELEYDARNGYPDGKTCALDGSASLLEELAALKSPTRPSPAAQLQ